MPAPHTGPMRRLAQSGTAGVLSSEFSASKALQLSPKFSATPDLSARTGGID